jgi:hypothetical protein
MKLLPKEVEETLPKLGSTRNEEDPLVRVKFFDPYGSWKWYVIEGEMFEKGNATILDGKEYPNDIILYGLVEGFENELGDFSLTELELIKTPWGMPRIERDLYFTPIRLSELMDKLARA